jgi:hypothetical protein
MSPDLGIGSLLLEVKLQQISLSLMSGDELLHIALNKTKLKCIKYDSHIDINFEIKHV